MGRAPCCAKEGLRKGPWSVKEDLLLTIYIKENGEGQWRNLPSKAGLLRCGKSCRLRWMNYLRPGIKRGNFSQDEEDLIIRLHSLLGNRWSLIAGRLPGRTDNEIKNYWNTHLIKKLEVAGIQRKQEPKKKVQSLHTPQVVFVPKPIKLLRNFSVEDIALLSTSSDLCCSDSPRMLSHSYQILKKCTVFKESNTHQSPSNLFFDEILVDECCDVSHDSMLEKVYEEYLQLISEKCYHQDDPMLI